MVRGVRYTARHILVPQQHDGGGGNPRMKRLGACLAARDSPSENGQPQSGSGVIRSLLNQFEKFGIIRDAGKQTALHISDRRRPGAIGATEQFEGVVAKRAGVGQRHISAGHQSVRRDSKCGATRPATIDRVLVCARALCDGVHRQSRISNGEEFVGGGVEDRLFQGSPTSSATAARVPRATSLDRLRFLHV